MLPGSCPESGGAPPAWAWVEALRALADHVPPGEQAAEACPLLGPGAAGRRPGRPRGRAGRTVPAAPGRDGVAAGRRGEPARRGRPGRPAQRRRRDPRAARGRLRGPRRLPVLLLAAYRPAEAGPGLAAALAVLARRSPVRVELTGLSEPASRRPRRRGVRQPGRAADRRGAGRANRRQPVLRPGKRSAPRQRRRAGRACPRCPRGCGTCCGGGWPGCRKLRSWRCCGWPRSWGGMPTWTCWSRRPTPMRPALSTGWRPG